MGTIFIGNMGYSHNLEEMFSDTINDLDFPTPVNGYKKCFERYG